MRMRVLNGLALALSLTLPATGHADARLQAVMHKLAAGEPVRLAVIGGSITTGYAAQPPRERGWAALLATSLGPRVTLVNAGLSGTDSAAAVQRLQAQLRQAVVRVQHSVAKCAHQARVKAVELAHCHDALGQDV